MNDNDKLQKANAIADEIGVDVLFYNGPVIPKHDDQLIETVLGRRRRKQVLLVLTTFGGNPNAAYRISRALQAYYERFVLYVPGYCKSAGTLIALGAHELVLSRHAELGPLDVQVTKHGEVGERSSGLTPQGAVSVLGEQAMRTFVEFFFALRFDVAMTTRMAAETACQLTNGLFSPIYGQIDPMRASEMGRAMRVAQEYGDRLTKASNNAKPGTLSKLMSGYPSHDFVIDMAEAKDLFMNVRGPSETESALTDLLLEIVRAPVAEKAFVFYLGSEANGNPGTSSDVKRPNDQGADPPSSAPRSGEDAGAVPADDSGEKASPAAGDHESGGGAPKRPKR